MPKVKRCACSTFFVAAGGGTRYQYGSVGRAEAVVYIYYGDVGRTGVQHPQKGCGAVETGSIADRGGYRDDGYADEAADYRGKRAFHARADDDGVGAGELITDIEETVEAGDTYVVKAGDAGVEELGCDGGFFGDRLVAGAGGEDGYVAYGLRGGDCLSVRVRAFG